MNTIDRIRAEIERMISAHKTKNGFPKGSFCAVRIEAYNEVLGLLATLEEETSYDTQKYTPSPSVDIGDVARVQFASHAKVFDKKRKAVFDWEQFKEVAGIFYGFGKKDSLSEEPVSEDLEEAAEEYAQLDDEGVWKDGGKYKGFIAGAEWQKEQMLKDAKDGYVSAIIIHNDGDEEHYAVTYPNGERPHSITDKVKIIIL